MGPKCLEGELRIWPTRTNPNCICKTNQLVLVLNVFSLLKLKKGLLGKDILYVTCCVACQISFLILSLFLPHCGAPSCNGFLHPDSREQKCWYLTVGENCLCRDTKVRFMLCWKCFQKAFFPQKDTLIFYCEL